MSYLILYVPVCLVALLVFETCRQDEPKAIVRKALKDFVILSLAFGIGSALLYALYRLL